MAEYSLKAVFGIDASGAKTELRNLTKETRSFVNDWGKIAAVAGVAVFTALAKGAVELAGSLADISANLGINVESFQALEAQHKRNGVTSETLTKALEKTKGAVIDAANGNKQAIAAFDALGLSAAKIIKLPLDQQYAAIAKAAYDAKDANVAYNAVTALFGDKVGPKLMGSLKELGEIGLPGVTAAAKEAGQVMTAETIVALDRAGDAIDDFKKKATIAVGNIIVNFRSEDGLKLLWLQLSAVVLKFGAGIVDAVVDASTYTYAVLKGVFKGVLNYFQDGFVDVVQNIATLMNKVLPAKFEINVGNLEALKSTGKGIWDEITDAIARTEPSQFRKTIGEASDAMVADQQKIVDALNKVDLGKDAEKLRSAGEAITPAVQKAAPAIVKAGVDAGKAIADAGPIVANEIEGAAESFADKMRKIAAAMVGAIAGIRGGQAFNNATDAALMETVRRNKQQATELVQSPTYTAATNIAHQLEAARLISEAANAQKELDTRAKVRTAFASGGTQGVYRAFGDTDPLILDKMIDQFARNLDESQKTSASLAAIQQGLAANGFIPNL